MRTMSGIDLTNPDSMGFAPRQRAQDQRWAAYANGGSIDALMNGNGMDPQWDAFLQATAENADHVGMGPSFNKTPATIYGGHESNQIGRAGQTQTMLNSLDRVTGKHRGLGSSQPASVIRGR